MRGAGADVGAPCPQGSAEHESSVVVRETIGAGDANYVSRLEARPPAGHLLARDAQPAPRTRAEPSGKLKPYLSMYFKVVDFSTA